MFPQIRLRNLKSHRSLKILKMKRQTNKWSQNRRFIPKSKFLQRILCLIPKIKIKKKTNSKFKKKFQILARKECTKAQLCSI